MQDYNTFIEKFQVKKTTDDCYTPEIIYDVIADFVADNYGVSRADFVRPFFPGGDYENYQYRQADIVVDNPPFSILAKIISFFLQNSIKFFMFANEKTLLSGAKFDEFTRIVTNQAITYENGAKVKTAFVTNLENEYIIRTYPLLSKLIKKAEKENQNKAQLPTYQYPDNVLTALMITKYCNIDYRVRKGEAVFISELDEQKPTKKTIYGGALLLSEQAAADRLKAEREAEEQAAQEKQQEKQVIKWRLSEREKEIVKRLSGHT